MERRTLAYWITTGLFCAVLGFSGFGHLTHLEAFVEIMTGLGYPQYFMTIIGTWMLLGVATLLAPRLPLLKEWAYAGFAFDLLGGAASHAISGDPVIEAINPAVVLLLGAASYLLRPAARRLPSAPVFGGAMLAEQPAGAPGRG